MYDDYDLDYTFTNDYADLDEYDNLDEDYARDAHDLEALAYRHYAWYNTLTYNLDETPLWSPRNALYVLH